MRALLNNEVEEISAGMGIGLGKILHVIHVIELYNYVAECIINGRENAEDDHFRRHLYQAYDYGVDFFKSSKSIILGNSSNITTATEL